MRFRPGVVPALLATLVLTAAACAADGVAFREHVDPIVGPAAFQAFAEKNAKENPQATVNWTTDKVQVAASSDWAVQTGTYNLTGLGPKGDGSDTGKFVTVWKKTGGAWKVAYDISETTAPAPAAKK
jgi:ketosteroid isomerase-like protein